MSRVHRWPAILAGIVVAWTLPAAPLRAQQEAKLLFHVPFDSGIDAALSAGAAHGELRPAGGASPHGSDRPAFVPGIRGQALEIGRFDYAVHFDPAGNMDPQGGTLTFWARRLGEAPAAPYTYHYVGWNQPDGSWVMIYNWSFNPLLALHGRGGSGDVGVQLGGERDDDGGWHMIGLTWEGRRVRGFLDGDPTGGQGDVADFPWLGFASFKIGPGCGVSRAMDELRVHDRPLAPAEIKREYRLLKGLESPPWLVVPPRAAPIEVDGKIGPEEWHAAVQTSAFIRADMTPAPTPTRVWASYDADSLYIAVSSELPEAVRQNWAATAGMTGILATEKTGFDTDVDSDDCVEVLLRPRGRDGNWYRLVVNGINVHYDYLITAAGNIQLDWNPNWVTASTLDDLGWHVEIRIPFADIAEGAPRAGDQWQVNIGRTWRKLQQGQDRLHLAAELDTTPVRFGDREDLVVRLADVGRLADAEASVDLEVLNTSDRAKRVGVRIGTDSREWLDERVVEVGPRSAVPISAARRLQDPSTSMLTVEVADSEEPEKETPAFRCQVPLVMRQLLEIRTAHFPTAGILRATFNAGRLRGTPLATLSGVLELRDEAGRTIAEGRLAPLPAYRADLELDVAQVPIGRGSAHGMVMQDGSIVAERTLPFEKRPLPPWYGNRIGISDKAPKPFTPVVRDGESIGVWGREYRYAGRLLPVQIMTQGGEILAGPIELVVTDAGGVEHSSAQVAAESRWGEHTGMRLELQRRAEIGPVRAEVVGWIECDGLLWQTLRVAPANVEIRKLELRIPLKKQWSEYVNNYDYSTRTSGRLARVGAGGMGVGTVCWLGSPSGGLQWMAEHTGSWRRGKGMPVAEVVVGPEGNTLVLHFVSEPAALEHGLEVAWGLIATPVRPPTPGYRDWLTSLVKPGRYFPCYAWYFNNRVDPTWPVLAGSFLLLTPHPQAEDIYPSYVGGWGQRDFPPPGRFLRSHGPYVIADSIDSRTEAGTVMDYWADEWSPSRLGRAEGHTSVGAASMRDFMLWSYRRLYDRARFVGVYYDNALYLPDDNYYHEQGYRRAGAWLATSPILGARELGKRMYCMLRELEPDQTAIMWHHSGMVNMAVLSWCDAYVDGENFTSQLSKARTDYHELYPVDAFLAQSMGHPFGLSNLFLDQFTRSRAITSDEEWAAVGSQPVDHLFGLILLHDSTYWMAHGRGYQHTLKVLRQIQFDERYELIPYWSQRVVELPENVYATFYRDAGARRVLLVLLNNNDRTVELDLRPDWALLGFGDPARVKVDDTWAATATAPQDPARAHIAAVCRALARLEGGRLLVPVGGPHARLLVLEE